MGEFRISHVRITFGREGGGIKKAGTRVVGWSPDFFCREMGGIHTSHIPAHPASATGAFPFPIPHSNSPHNPISHRIDEDALEGVYFAF